MTVIRPNGTPAGASSYTVTGAATAHAALSDDLDATYIRKAGSSTASIILGFGTFSIASNEQVKRVRLRARAQTPESTSKLNLQLGIKVSGVSTYGPAYSLRGVNATGEYLGPYYTQAPDGNSWDQARINGLRVQVTDYKAGTAKGYVYELYADVDLATQPSASVISPTGTVTDTSSPEISWTFTDSDGDAQAFYQVKIYTQAQYTAGDFNADETTATWDSGEVNSSDVSATVGTYLTNAVYRAYVRVAKTVNGAPFWSPWAFGGFTISVTPPSIPTLTASWNSSLNKVTLEATGALAAGFDYQRYTVQRSTNQATWVDVRDAAELIPNASYLATVVDYEAPRGGLVYYRTRALGITGDNTVTSAWSSAVSVNVTNDGKWWFKAVYAPTLNTGTVRVLAGLQETVEEDAGVFRPKGRSTAVVVAGSIYGRDGMFNIAAFGDTEWDPIYALARHQGPLLVQDPFGDQRYIRITTRQITTDGSAAKPIRRLMVSYVEVSA